jgi:hypothetical protein
MRIYETNRPNRAHPFKVAARVRIPLGVTFGVPLGVLEKIFETPVILRVSSCPE